MNKALSKATMQRTKLKNKFLKDLSAEINFPTTNKKTDVFHYYEKNRINTLPI